MLKLDWNLLFTLINLIVFYFLMRKFLIKPITNIMEERKKLIENGLSQARQNQDEALKLKEQYEAALVGARSESSKIVADARQSAKAEYDRVMQEANRDAGALMENAQKTIELEKAKAMHDLKSQVAGLALEAARKVTGKCDHSQEDIELYDQFLSEAGDSHDTDA